MVYLDLTDKPIQININFEQKEQINKNLHTAIKELERLLKSDLFPKYVLNIKFVLALENLSTLVISLF